MSPNRKELKAPDAFLRTGAGVRDWLQAREKVVATMFAALLLVGFGLALAHHVGNKRDETAAKELGDALKTVERPVSEGLSSEKEGQPPPFKSFKEKDEAIAAALQPFLDQQKGTRPALIAALSLGYAELRLKNADRAMAAFDEYLKSAAHDEPLRGSAWEGRGYAFEAKGQLDQALGAFEQLSREGKGDFLVGMGLYHRARILALQKKNEEAAKAFREVTTAYPGSAAARMASERLAMLKSEGKDPTAPTAGAKDAGR